MQEELYNFFSNTHVAKFQAIDYSVFANTAIIAELKKNQLDLIFSLIIVRNNHFFT